MTSCFVCKKDVGENYLVFTFDRTSDGYFTIGDPDESKHGLAVVVCKECQRRFVIDRIKELLEKDCINVEAKELKDRLMRVLDSKDRELRACPFCKGEAMVLSVNIPSYEGEDGYYVPGGIDWWCECMRCHVATVRANSKIVAMKMWNMRVKE